MVNINSLPNETLLLNRYLIKKELGEGGFGRTYLIEDTQNNHKKLVLKEFLSNENGQELNQKSRQLFEQEAKILGKLNHPQIPEFLHFFEDNNKVFIVQQYIEGDNYWDLFCQKRITKEVFQETEVIKWLKDLLPILDYIHNLNPRVIHRDISLDNIIYFDQIQKPVLIDFGVVKQKMMTVVNGDNFTTKQGTIVGKIGYSAPEQLKTGSCYPNSDLYALGVSALALLTGLEPHALFNSYNQEKEWYKYVNISDNFKQILDNMLAEYPSERYNYAREVLEDLNNINSPNFIANQNINKQDNLPKTKQVAPDKSIIDVNQKPKQNKHVVLISLLALLGLGGGVIGINSPHITAICKTLDNCAKDKKYEQNYQQILVSGASISSNYNQAKSISELESNLNNLDNLITELKNFPPDVKVSSKAEIQLIEYEHLAKNIDEKIAQEKTIENKFNEIAKSIDNLKLETEKSQSVNSYQKIKSQWQDLQKQLKNIEENSFVISKANAKIIESKNKIDYIDNQINKLQIAAEKRRQQQAAQLAAERRRQEEARIARRKANQNRNLSSVSNTNKPSPISPRKNIVSTKKPAQKILQKSFSPPKSSPPKPTSQPNVSRKGKVW